MPENPVEQKASDSQILARVRECYANDETLGGGGVHPETLADDLPIAVNTTRNRCKDLADRGELERDWGFDGGQHRLGYRPARDRTVALRDSETRDDSSHASVVDAQLAEADPETRAEIEERHEVRTDGGRPICTDKACDRPAKYAAWMGDRFSRVSEPHPTQDYNDGDLHPHVCESCLPRYEQLHGDSGEFVDPRERLVTDGGTDDTHQLEISVRQRARFERVKAECTDEHLPEPTDDQILKSLIDTWDAVADGLYSDDETDDGTEQKTLVTDGGVPSSRDTEQTRLPVGDTRKPTVIKEAQRVTTGDLAALAMCAHRYDPADVWGWYTHEFDDVLRQWICSNVGSVIARLSPHCEYTRGERTPLHPSDDLWVGEADTGPSQTRLEEVC